MAAPEWPPRVREVLRSLGIEDLYRWWQDFSRWLSTTIAGLSSGSTVDHGGLIGLGDDDHTQYLNTTRHDTTTRHGATVVDHGGIGGLTDDDHAQYLKLAGRSGGQIANGGTASGDDLVLMSTAHATKGDVYVGGDGSANRCTVESDGTLRFDGTATVWDDIRITPGSFDRPGVADPAYVSYQPSGAGITTYLPEFAKNDLVSFSIQLPHGYDMEENIYVHVHWTPGANGVAESGNTVGWKIDYSWANIDGTFGAMATADLSDACDGVDHKHQMTPEVAIVGSGKHISSMLICNLSRTDTGADDTWAGAGAGSLPLMLEVDFHFPIDTVGSRARSTK